ncbi:glycosyltransferase family 4 protein [Spiribacter aquaticus]|uniref:Glycosyltransferase family 4 protein n=2 Tax=Ectothiorhodospiraceae TaxID=72276 RepID=A0A557RMQ5_9GAMM|nr:glycosyltransferase family 4 protein [Spiribacter aquaticus]
MRDNQHHSSTVITTEGTPMSPTSANPKALIAVGEGHVTEVELIIRLRDHGIDAHAAFESSSPHLTKLRDAGVPTRTLDLKSNIDLPKAKLIRNWVIHERFDILHGLGNRQVANFITASYGLKNKVIAYRGAVGHVSRWDPTCYLKWLNPRLDCLICVSNAVKADLASNGVPETKLVTIHKGHDISWYSGLDRHTARHEINELFAIPEDSILVGMVANMRYIKGADMLIQALHFLPDNVHAILIGEVRDPNIEKLASNSNIASRVHFTGYRSDAVHILAGLDINTAPSRREGLPKSVIEGMAQGIPAVVTNAGGLPEIIDDGDNGFIVPIDDLNAFSRHLAKLIADSELRDRMGQRAKEKMLRSFDIRKTVESTAALYHQLLP